MPSLEATLKLAFLAALSAYYATRATVPRAGVSLTVPVFFKEGANAILRKRSSLQKKCTHGRCQTCGHPTPQQRKHRRRRPLWRVRYRRNKPRGKSTEEGPQTPQLSATTGAKRTPARAHSSDHFLGLATGGNRLFEGALLGSFVRKSKTRFRCTKASGRRQTCLV